MKPYADHRKARYHYEILETFEGGLALTGQEVKSIREGGAKLEGAYLRLIRGELWLVGARIAPYTKSTPTADYDPEAPRKVLVRQRELRVLLGKTQQKGLTLIPLSFYPKARRIKISFALCRGRKAPDKREKLKARDLMREASRG